LERAACYKRYEDVDKVKRLDQYQRVEILLDSVGVPYCFRIWHIHPHSNVILVKEDSDIVAHLQVGGRLKMKYYSPGEAFGVKETSIKRITREEQGRFKGHFLVDLEPL
jgi:hypothetical protein